MLKYYLPVIPVLVKSPYSFRVRAQIPSEYNKNSKVINYLTDCNKDDIVVLAKKHTKEDVDYLISKNINYIFEQIKNHKILDDNGIIIMHRHKNENDLILEKINILEEKTYGVSKIFFVSLN